MFFSALVGLFACVSLSTFASETKDHFDYKNLPEDLQLKIISSLRAKDIINMSRASTTSQRQTRAALTSMDPKDIAKTMIKFIQEIAPENYKRFKDDSYDSTDYEDNDANDFFYGNVNDFCISLSRIIDPQYYEVVAREFADHAWDVIRSMYDSMLSHFIGNKENMQNDFMIEILAASSSCLYPAYKNVGLSIIVKLLRHMSNPECAEGVKRVVRIFSQNTNLLKDEVATADQTNDWSVVHSMLYDEYLDSPFDYLKFLTKS